MAAAALRPNRRFGPMRARPQRTQGSVSGDPISPRVLMYEWCEKGGGIDRPCAAFYYASPALPGRAFRCTPRLRKKVGHLFFSITSAKIDQLS